MNFNQLGLKVRMFFNNLSPLHIVYSKDSKGDYLLDSENNPIPERYTPPTILTHWKAYVVAALIIYGLFQLLKLIITLKFSKQ